MQASELIERIQAERPNLPLRLIFQKTLLLTNAVTRIDILRDDKTLREALDTIDLQFAAVTDQHAAMTEELEQAGRTGEVSMETIWTLIRAIKIQSQILQLFIGDGSAHDDSHQT